MNKKEIECVVSYDVKTGKTTRHDNRFDAVRELVKDPSLRVTEIAWKTGYNKGHVSRLRKEYKEKEAPLYRREGMSENKTAKTPTDSGTGFIDGFWYGPGPTAWQCQCGKAYTVTCISSKPAKQWVSLTDEEVWNAIDDVLEGGGWLDVARVLEAAIKRKNT